MFWKWLQMWLEVLSKGWLRPWWMCLACLCLCLRRRSRCLRATKFYHYGNKWWMEFLPKSMAISKPRRPQKSSSSMTSLSFHEGSKARAPLNSLGTCKYFMCTRLVWQFRKYTHLKTSRIAAGRTVADSQTKQWRINERPFSSWLCGLSVLRQGTKRNSLWEFYMPLVLIDASSNSILKFDHLF